MDFSKFNFQLEPRNKSIRLNLPLVKKWKIFVPYSFESTFLNINSKLVVVLRDIDLNMDMSIEVNKKGIPQYKFSKLHLTLCKTHLETGAGLLNYMIRENAKVVLVYS